MIRLALILCVLLGPAGVAGAQTIPVRSGEHADFTRLVLTIGAEREWTLQPEGDDRWVLALTPEIDGFDSSGVFERVPRTRLRALSGEAALTLDLACACSVTGSRYNGQYLVIDISDPDPNAPLTPDPADSGADERAEAAAALPSLSDLLSSPSALPLIPNQAAPTSEPAAMPEESAADDHAAEAPNQRLEEAAEIMAEQLARAAAAGLLDAALDQPLTMADPPHTPVEAAPDPARPRLHPEDLAGTESTVEDSLPIHADTAFDRRIQLDLPIARTRQPGACTGEPFDVRDWATGAGFEQGLGELRITLYDDRDVLNQTGATDLARYYLHYGFGAEAAYWLRQVPDPPVTLLHVAALVDGAPSAAFPEVEFPSECAPGELLWRYLAGAVPAALTAEELAALQRAFADLPPILRDHTGPRLAIALMEDGHTSAAINIRDVLHRGGRINAGRLAVLDLELGVTPNHSGPEIRTTLAEALRDDGGDPVSIMSQALALDRQMGILPAPDRVTAAEALLRETGAGPETNALWHEVLLAHAAIGGIDAALAMLGDPDRSEGSRGAALTALIAERVSVGDTAALVILAHTHGREWHPEGSDAGRAQVGAIAALRADGLYEAANILRDVRRPLILPAPAAPPPTGESDAVAAWEDGNWQRLSEAGTGPHADIARRMVQLAADQAAEAPEPPFAPDLAFLSDQVADSRALRGAIADLLARPTLP